MLPEAKSPQEALTLAGVSILLLAWSGVQGFRLGIEAVEELLQWLVAIIVGGSGLS